MFVVNIQLGISDGIVGVVMLGVGGFALGLQPLLQHPLDQLDDYGEDGDTDDHTHHAPQGATNGDGDDDAQGADTGVVAQDLGADDVAVQLLNDKDKDQEQKCFIGVGDQHYEEGGDGSDEGAEDRDDVGDAHEGGDEQVIGGDLKNAQHDEGQDADDQGVQDLAVDEAAEGLVGQGRDLTDTAVVFLAEHGSAEFADLGNALFFRGQNIKGDEKAEKQVLDRVEQSHEYTADLMQDVSVAEELLYFVEDLGIVALHVAHYLIEVVGELFDV